MLIHLDIETIPTQREDIRARIAETIRPPATMSKPDTIAEWAETKKPAAVEKAIHDTGLSGTFGEVFCIAWAVEDGPIGCAWRTSLADPEEHVLRAFFAVVKGAWSNQDRPVFVGHYITGFDLRFLWQRAVVNGVKPPSIPFNAKPWDSSVFDTCIEWAGVKGGVSQDDLCRALNIDCKDGIDGSMVWDLVKAGKCAEVAEYCKGDVHRVREIYRRMKFAA